MVGALRVRRRPNHRRGREHHAAREPFEHRPRDQVDQPRAERGPGNRCRHERERDGHVGEALLEVGRRARHGRDRHAEERSRRDSLGRHRRSAGERGDNDDATSDAAQRAESAGEPARRHRDPERHGATARTVRHARNARSRAEDRRRAPPSHHEHHSASQTPAQCPTSQAPRRLLHADPTRCFRSRLSPRPSTRLVWVTAASSRCSRRCCVGLRDETRANRARSASTVRT